jgi:hypothetical protein
LVAADLQPVSVLAQVVGMVDGPTCEPQHLALKFAKDHEIMPHCGPVRSSGGIGGPVLNPVLVGEEGLALRILDGERASSTLSEHPAALGAVYSLWRKKET